MKWGGNSLVEIEECIGVLEYFEDREDYEKCQILSDFINSRFNHVTNYLK